MKRVEDSLRDLTKLTNIQIIEVPEEEEVWEKARVWENIWGQYSLKHGKGNRHPGPKESHTG